MMATDLPCADAESLAQIFATLATVLASPPTDQTASTVAHMASSLGLACPGEVPLAALERDYTDLFVVPNPRYVAPYESVYRDPVEVPDVPGRGRQMAPEPGHPRGLLMGASTLEVRQAQLEAGVQPEQDLPDHVANELWFIAHLCRQQAAAPPAERAEWALRRERFTDEHLRLWLDDLSANVRRNQRCEVYAVALAVARAAVDFQ